MSRDRVSNHFQFLSILFNDVWREGTLLNLNEKSSEALRNMDKVYEANGKIWHPESIEECFESLGDAPFIVPKKLFCNATWDTVLCWPPTLRGSTTKLPCPEYLGVGHNRFASKSCGVDGKWIGSHPGKEIFPKELYPGWTNYSECTGLVYDVANDTDIQEVNVTGKAPVSFGVLPLLHNAADTLGSVLLSVSIVLLFTSIVVTCCARVLQSTRLKIYRNFFAALIVHDTLELVIRLGRTMESNDVINDVETCVSIGVLVTLTSSAIYTWLTIITVSLTLTMKGIVIEPKMYYVLCLLGWFIPTVITITWLSVTVLEGNLNCWYGELYIAKLQSGFWIIEGINILLISLSWILLIHFLWKFNSKISNRRYGENKDIATELVNIKQSAFKILGVLSFVTSAYIIYVTAVQDKLLEPIAYLFAITLFSRGIVASILLCFLEKTFKCWDGMYTVENFPESENSVNTASTM